MSVIISRQGKPELFRDEERPLSDVINTIEAVYSEICTKTDGYEQQDLLTALRNAGISQYDANIAISILFQTKKILSIIG